MATTVLFFGQLTDITLQQQVLIEGVSDTDQLLSRLHENYPALQNAKYILAVNKNVVSSNTILSDHSTVALLPPFSGG